MEEEGGVRQERLGGQQPGSVHKVNECTHAQSLSAAVSGKFTYPEKDDADTLPHRPLLRVTSTRAARFRPDWPFQQLHKQVLGTHDEKYDKT